MNTNFAANSMHPSRPVRCPGEQEARIALSNDLARGLRGVDQPRAAIIARLPLFEVALDGRYGYLYALRMARQRKAA